MSLDPDLPVGESLPNWLPRPMPSRAPAIGRYTRLEPLSEEHAEGLHSANQLDGLGRSWTYLPYGPFPDVAGYREWVAAMSRSETSVFFAIIDQTERPVGVASYDRVQPIIGSIEVAHIHYSPLLQRRREATEAMYLMMFRIFEELKYRRYEWKCDSLNAGSLRAAERLGFVYEGTFRQAAIYKGRSRDTAWYSIIDSEWPRVRAKLEAWLEPTNFDTNGVQRSRLGLG